MVSIQLLGSSEEGVKSGIAKREDGEMVVARVEPTEPDDSLSEST